MLVVVAAPKEAEAVQTAIRGLDGASVLETGVGKAAAAAATGARLTADLPRIVLNAGIAGALQGGKDFRPVLGQSVLAEASAFADEGVRTPRGFRSCAQIGFPIAGSGDSIPGEPHLLRVLGPLADHVGVIATVSTCSGTDELAAEIARRTGAIAEAMEGAAVGLACRRAGTPFAELRVISNTTGDRDRQQWDLTGSLEKLGAIVRAAAEALIADA